MEILRDDVPELGMGDVNQAHHDRDHFTSHPDTFVDVTKANTVNQSLSGYSTSMTQSAYSTVIAHKQPLNPTLQILMSGQASIMFGQVAIKQSMDYHFDRLQVENKELREQLFQMQAKLDEKQAKLDEKQDQMLQMQQQALDRLAIIQSSVLALATQTYELHEYPIPRLFIVLPKTLGLSGKIKSLISDQFRLYFLCECGTHTMSKGAKTPPQIHLAKHEGYDLEKPTVFFERYGSYLLTLMNMIKYGITAASLVVPPLATSKIVDGIDAAQKHLEYLKKNIAPLIDDTIKILGDIKSNQKMGEGLSEDNMEFSQLEALEGADLRQLESIVTSEGHVKWVCFDHYRATYRETAIKRLQEIVNVNDGTYTEETGSIKIELTTSIQARQFYDAMVKVRCIQELEITFKWDVTMDDLREFAGAVTKANVVSLIVNGSYLKSPALDVVNRTRRFDPIMKLASNGRIQSLHIKGFDDFFGRVSKSSILPSLKLRALAVQSELPLRDKFKSINSLLNNYPGLKALQVKLDHRCSIANITLHILKELPKLESLKVDCGTLSIDASIVKDNVHHVSLTTGQINDLIPKDLEVIQEDSFDKLRIKYVPQEEDMNRLPDALQSRKFNRVQVMTKGGCSAILASHEWKLQDLVDITTSEALEETASFLIDCQRLTLSAELSHGKRQDMTVTIRRLDRINSDDLTYVNQGHITRLVIMQTPKDEDMDRLTDILHNNRELRHLEINRGEEQDSDTGNAHKMKLLDMISVVTQYSSSTLESFSVDWQRFSLTIEFSQGTRQHTTAVIKRLDRLNSDDLTYVNQGHLTRLVIMQTPKNEDMDRLTDILHNNRELKHLEINRGEEQDSDTGNAHKMKLLDMISVVTQHSSSTLELFSVDWQRFSLTIGFSQSKRKDMTVAIQRLDRLNSEDLTYINQGHITRLVIMQDPKAKDKNRLTDIFRNNCELKHIEINYGEEQDSDTGNALKMKLPDVVSVVTQHSSSTLESFSVDCQQLSLAIGFSQCKRQDMTVTIKRLDRLNLDDLTYINQGHLTRLVLMRTSDDEDKDRLTDILHNNWTLKHLEIKYRCEQDATIGNILGMELLEREIKTPNILSELQSFTIDWQRVSLTAEYLQGKREDSAVIQQLDRLTPNDLTYLQKSPLNRLTIMQIPRDEDKDRLADIIHHNKNLYKLDVKCGEKRDPAIDNSSEMTLLKLDSVILSNKSSVRLVSIEYQRLSLDAYFLKGERGSVGMVIKQLDHLNSDDLHYIQQGHLTALLIMQTPRDEDKSRLANILRHSNELQYLEIKCEEEQAPATGNVSEMALLDLDSVILSNKSTMLRSVSIEYRRLSLSADFSEGKRQSMAMIIKQLDHLNSDDLHYIQRGYLTRLTLMQTLKDEDKDRLADIIHHNKGIYELEIKCEEERGSATGNVSEMALLDLDSVILSNKSTMLRSVSIEYRRLSLKTGFLGSLRLSMAMVIKQLDHLNSNDLQYIQQGYLTNLTIMQTPREEDTDRFSDILRLSQGLSDLKLSHRDRQDPVVNASEMKLLDLVTLLTLNTLGKLGSITCEINYERASLISIVREGKVQDIVMKIKHLSDLSSDNLGHLTGLEIDNTPLNTDEARLAKVLKINTANFHLQIGDKWGSLSGISPNRKHRGGSLSSDEMSLWDIAKVVTSSTIESLKIGYWGCSFITGVSHNKDQDLKLTIDCCGDLNLESPFLDDLETFQWDIFTELSIQFRHFRQGRLDAIMKRFSYIHFRHGGLHNVIITTPERKLQDLVDLVTSESPEELRSFLISCPRLSITADFSQGNCQNMAMTTERLGYLNSDDLAFIQRGCLSRLTIKQTLQEADKVQLIEIKRSCPSLDVACKERVA
ncbi:hypothetical protein BGX34_011579 [Mortierella sp. NVP85]|nr:hypothetical protein BGX34_011579 [Mortierella sp. NVP85]